MTTDPRIARAIDILRAKTRPVLDDIARREHTELILSVDADDDLDIDDLDAHLEWIREQRTQAFEASFERIARELCAMRFVRTTDPGGE